MARLLGPDMGSRAVFLPTGAPAVGRIATFYTDATGTVLADIAAYQPGDPETPGAAIAGSQLAVDAYGLLPLLWFPDGVDRIWVTVNGGPLVPIDADFNARIDAAVTTAAAEAAARTAADVTLTAAVAAETAARTAAVTAEATARAAAVTTVGGLPAPSPAVVCSTPAPIAVMVTALQSGHGFTGNGGGSTNLNDTADYVLGTQSASLTTGGDGVARTLRRLGMTPFSATGRQPVVWVKVVDDTHMAGLKLYLGDTSLTNNYQFEMKSSAGQRWLVPGLWHRLQLSWGEATTTLSPNRGVLTDVQFRVVDDNTGNPVVAHFNGFGLADETTAWPDGVVSITFDDTYATTYTVGRAYMDRYGYPGTAYIIQDYIGQANRMTLAQLHDLERFSGWEVAGHASTGAVHAARFTSFDAAAMAAEAVTIRKFLRDNGFRGQDHLAYPGGEFNDTVLAVTEQYFAAARTVFQRPEVLPPARASKVRCGGYVTNVTAAATITAAVDQAAANKEWLVLAFHDLVTTPGSSTEYSIANFQTIIDHIAGAGIPVRTVGDVLRTKP